MFEIIILSLILSESVISVFVKPSLNESFVYNVYKYGQLIDLTVNKSVMQILDFEEDSDLLSVYPTRVHVGTNDSISVDYPLLVTASQQKGISSWDLPLVINTKDKELHFNDMARTLCPHDAGSNITAQGRPTMTLSTSSAVTVSVRIKVRRVQDFYLEVNKEVELNASPSTPKYYYFSFDRDPWHLSAAHSQLFPKFNYTIPKSVLLTIDSDDDVCAIVSVQNNSCPVFDNERDVTYRGYHFTMTRNGGITVTQSMFPLGFYVVFIVKESDEDCTGVVGEAPTSDKRIKKFRVRAAATTPAGALAVGAVTALALMLLVAMLAPIISSLSCQCSETVTVTVQEEEEQPGPSRREQHAPPRTSTDDVDSEVESELDVETECEREPLQLPLNVAGLCRTHPQAHLRRSNRYFSSAFTVAVVYALPVVQLLATYQARVRQSGDQDECYYNFRCAYPLGVFSDFNHVFSNIGYVLLGIIFMVQVRCRARHIRPTDMGIPEHPGLLYSMGLALVMEGVLSACYHLCPNKMNFQFDSSFMYVIAVLCLVKLYGSRHADVTAGANATFLLLAFLMAIGVVGIMDPSVTFWVLFTTAHLAACLYFTVYIYYLGRFKMEWPSLRWCGGGVRSLRPSLPARAVLLALANLANWALAAYGLAEHNKDFARHLLAVLLVNTLLHTAAYVALKLAHAERLAAAAWLWLALALLCWTAAAVFFLDSRTKWSETAAQSRTHNAACSVLQVFDSHDVWHLASAAAVYCSFNALLVLDDPLHQTPRRLIPVF